MSGIDYLLDTNVILGLLKSAPETLSLLDDKNIKACQCGYSAITRMELLGYTGISIAEIALINSKLAKLWHVPLTLKIEDEVIRLRQTRRIKLPDAVIAATAHVHGASLLTHDKALLAAIESTQTAYR